MFQRALRSKIYVDKSKIIAYTNSALMTEQAYICVSWPRRFGKTMTANMISAYYSRGCDSSGLFESLAAAAEPTYGERLNQYNVISLNIQQFLSSSKSIKDMIVKIEENVSEEIFTVYPALKEILANHKLTVLLQRIYQDYGHPVILIIDEWDCIFREYRTDSEAQKTYLDYLRDLLKDRMYVALAYMTGILPIKKYGSHSALNMFREFSMTDSGKLAEFVGFTKDEVLSLCEKYGFDYEEMAHWYNGYSFPEIKAVYNPKSVVEALLNRISRGKLYPQTS